MGIDPRPFTLREMLWMAEGRLKHNWDETAGLLAALANIFRDTKRSKTYTAIDFNPYRRASGIKRSSMAELKGMLRAYGVLADGR